LDDAKNLKEIKALGLCMIKKGSTKGKIKSKIENQKNRTQQVGVK